MLTLFALSDPWMARRHLLTNADEVRLNNESARAAESMEMSEPSARI